METKIHTYLTFNGNCREAMTFYRECLGGKLFFQTIGGSPLAENMPVQLKKNILHSTLTKGNMILMGSDIVSEQGLIKGNAISIMLNCSSETEIKTFYKRLATGGASTHPLERTFYGALFGDLTDKYGNQWLLHFSKNQI